MVAKFTLLGLVALAIVAEARMRRDAPDPTATEEAFKEVINKAEAAVKQAGEHLSTMLGLDTDEPAGERLVNLIKAQSMAFTAQAEQVQRQLETELKDLENGSVATAFSEISKKIEETVTSFRNQIESSGVSERAAELQSKFQEGINTLVEEGKKLATTLEPQVHEAGKKLEGLARKVIDDAVDNLNELQTKVHAATAHGDHP